MLHAAPPPGCRGGADYVPGMGPDGEAVAPADLGPRGVPVPSQVLIPLPGHPRGPGGRGYVVLDGAQIAPLVDPPPCRD